MNNIALLRGELGITQEQLAKCLGISRSNLAMLEKGTVKKTSKKTLEKLCSFFNTTPIKLFGLDSIKYELQDGDREFLSHLLMEDARKCEK